MRPLAALTFGGDGHFHALMLWLVAPTSAVGFALGYRVHAKAGIVLTWYALANNILQGERLRQAAAAI